jgi:hypothetical protein
MTGCLQARAPRAWAALVVDAVGGEVVLRELWRNRGEVQKVLMC